MSAILGFGGNIFDVVATHEHYIEYRPTDTTLNIWNYEPVYAARWSEPMEIAPIPRALIAFLPFRPGSNTSTQVRVGPAPTQNIGTGVIDGNDPLEVPGTAVPEPGYGLLIALLFFVLWVRLRHREACPQLLDRLR